jgi:hypothetical protein
MVSVCLFAFPALVMAQGPGTNLNQKVADLEARMSAVEARLSTAETSLTDAEARLSTAETSLTDAQTRLSIAETSLNDAQKRLSTTEKLLTQINQVNAVQAQQIVFLGATLVPAGAIIPYSAEAVPEGYLECDGRPVLRADYPRLFAAIGTAWGAGDGASTFNLPDMRGLFLRGWSHGSLPLFDPDRSGRTQLTVGGASGDHVGSFQIDQFHSHFHNVHSAALNIFGPYSPVAGGNASGVDLAGFTLAVGGNETRPRNVAVMYAIKY